MSLRVTTLAAALVLAMASGAAAQSRVFTVNTTADTADAVPGDGLCADSAGTCSLRAAITEANTGTSAAGDRVDLPAGLYTLSLGNLKVTANVSIQGAGSVQTIIDGSHDARGVFEFGQTVFSRKLFQGVNTATGQLIARAIATTETDDATNCLASEGCLGKPGLVDSGGSNPIGPLTYDFFLTPSEVTAIAQTPGIGVLTVDAARDIGHRLGATVGAVADVIPATLDGVPAGQLFEEALDSCPPGENADKLDCGPNFHTDVIASSSRFISTLDFQAAAQDSHVQVVLSPTTGPDRAGVGRLKIFGAQLLYLKQPHVVLRGLAVQHGSDAAVRTATIFNISANVEAFDLVLKDNFGSAGGALWNDLGNMALEDCAISGNTAYAGGGIFNGRLGVMALRRCTVSGNQADVQSGGGVLNSGQLELTNTTVSGNLAKLGGGGVSNTGFLQAIHATITDNSANSDLSGNFDPAAVGGGIANVCLPGVCGFVAIGNSILAGNRDGRDSGLPTLAGLLSPDCYSTGIPSPPDFVLRFKSNRNNLFGVVPAKTGVVNAICDIRDLDSITSDDTPFDQVGRPGNPVDPALEPLADNGGYTRTHALPPGSPAINAVTESPGPAACPPTDQRGFRRPGDGAGDTVCDSGAYENGSQTAVPEDPATRTSPVTVTFTNITQPGITRLEILSSGPPPPSGFSLGNPPVYYEVSTTTTFTPPVKVCIDFSGTTVANPAALRLFHFEDTNADGTADTWVDRTLLPVDTVNKIICASVDSFSLFAPFERVNRPPQANAGPDQRVECDAAKPVTLDGSASTDPDGDVLRYEWRNAAGAVVGSTSSVSLVLPPGANALTLTVSDPGGLKSSDGALVTVRDTSRPVIDRITASPDVLWPPNNKLVPVTVDVSVADRCDAAPSCRIVSVSSSEACSSRDASDWQIVSDLTVKLRAERAERGKGRTYTVTVECRDAALNRTKGTVTVKVPHDRR